MLQGNIFLKVGAGISSVDVFRMSHYYDNPKQGSQNG